MEGWGEGGKDGEREELKVKERKVVVEKDVRREEKGGRHE